MAHVNGSASRPVVAGSVALSHAHPHRCPQLEGDISDLTRGRFDKGLSVPQLCAALQKAALDPRVKGLCVEIGPLAVGWGKLQEIRRWGLAHQGATRNTFLCV